MLYDKKILAEEKAVIDLLQDRKSGKVDDRKLGLFLPGGGMRGAFSGGAMIALQELGFTDIYDYVYGFSSGAFSGAYLLSEKADIGTSIYYNDLSGKKFIRPWKLTKAMDMDYFCDYVVRKKKPLDINKIKNAKSTFKIFVTNCCDGKLTAFSNRDEVDMVTALKATCSFPGFSYPAVTIDGKEYVDGNSFEYTPIEVAIADGCTDILIISTMPTYYRERFFTLINMLTLPFTYYLPKGFRVKLKFRTKLHNRDLKILADRDRRLSNVNLCVVSPDYHISSNEARASVLKEFAEHGTSKVLSLFQRTPSN